MCSSTRAIKRAFGWCQVAFEIRVHDPRAILIEQYCTRRQRVFATTSGPESVAVLGKPRLEDGFNDLRKAVCQSGRAPWDAKGASRTSRVWYPDR